MVRGADISATFGTSDKSREPMPQLVSDVTEQH